MSDLSGRGSGPLVVRLTRAAVESLREHGALVVELRVPVDTRAELRARVADYLAENPGASANQVREAIRGRRRDVLCAVRELRGRLESDQALETSSTRCPSPGYRAGDGGTA